MNKTTLFISREIAEDSILQKLTSTLDFQIQAFSLLEFKAIDFAFKQSDGWLFFYSSKGVYYFMQGIASSNVKQIQESLAGIKIAAMGKGTRKSLEQYHVDVDFTASSNLSDDIADFTSLVQQEMVCFVQASKSLRSFQKQIGKRIKSKDLVVYQNCIKKEVPKIDADILVFTSPMNVEAYFNQHQPSEGQQLIAIGHSTKDKILRYGEFNVGLPIQPSEEDIYDLISKKYI